VSHSGQQQHSARRVSRAKGDGGESQVVWMSRK